MGPGRSVPSAPTKGATESSELMNPRELGPHRAILVSEGSLNHVSFEFGTGFACLVKARCIDDRGRYLGRSELVNQAGNRRRRRGQVGAVGRLGQRFKAGVAFKAENGFAVGVDWIYRASIPAPLEGKYDPAASSFVRRSNHCDRRGTQQSLNLRVGSSSDQASRSGHLNVRVSSPVVTGMPSPRSFQTVKSTSCTPESSLFSSTLARKSSLSPRYTQPSYLFRILVTLPRGSLPGAQIG